MKPYHVSAIGKNRDTDAATGISQRFDAVNAEAAAAEALRRVASIEVCFPHFVFDTVALYEVSPARAGFHPAHSPLPSGFTRDALEAVKEAVRKDMTHE
jgi:hypothetical protein